MDDQDFYGSQNDLRQDQGQHGASRGRGGQGQRYNRGGGRGGRGCPPPPRGGRGGFPPPRGGFPPPRGGPPPPRGGFPPPRGGPPPPRGGRGGFPPQGGGSGGYQGPPPPPYEQPLYPGPPPHGPGLIDHHPSQPGPSTIGGQVFVMVPVSQAAMYIPQPAYNQPAPAPQIPPLMSKRLTASTSNISNLPPDFGSSDNQSNQAENRHGHNQPNRGGQGRNNAKRDRGRHRKQDEQGYQRVHRDSSLESNGSNYPDKDFEDNRQGRHRPKTNDSRDQYRRANRSNYEDSRKQHEERHKLNPRRAASVQDLSTGQGSNINQRQYRTSDGAQDDEDSNTSHNSGPRRGNRGRGRGRCGKGRGGRGNRPTENRDTASGWVHDEVTAQDSDESIYDDSDMEPYVSEASNVADIDDVADDTNRSFYHNKGNRGQFSRGRNNQRGNYPRGSNRGSGNNRERRPRRGGGRNSRPSDEGGDDSYGDQGQRRGEENEDDEYIEENEVDQQDDRHGNWAQRSDRGRGRSRGKQRSRGRGDRARGGGGRRGRGGYDRQTAFRQNSMESSEGSVVVEDDIDVDDIASLDGDNENVTETEPENAKKTTSSYEIKLDDIETAPLQCLINRAKRYRTRLNEFKRADGDPEEIKTRQDRIGILKAEIEKRRKSEQEKKSKALNDAEHVNIKSDEAEYEDSEGEQTAEYGPSFNNDSDGNGNNVPVIKSAMDRMKKISTVSKERSIPKMKTKVKNVPRKVDEVVQTANSSWEEGLASDFIDIIDEPENDVVDEPETLSKKKKPRQRKKKPTANDEIYENNGENKEQLKEAQRPAHAKKKTVDNPNTIQVEDRQAFSEFSQGLAELINKPQLNQSSITSPSKIATYEGDSKEKKKNEAPPVPAKQEKPTLPTGDFDLANDVFKFLVKEYKGKGEPLDIRRESGLFPIECDVGKWFKTNKRLFQTIERGGKVIQVLAFMKDISYCLDYIKKSRCSKLECQRFHVCKDMLCGNCIYGDQRCRFSHNFLDERNIKVAKQLGLSRTFNSEEICTILTVRYPHICDDWAEDGECTNGKDCPNLHLCPRFIFGKCVSDLECPLGHDKCSEHNKPIVNAYAMSKWADHIFRRMIYMKRSGGGQLVTEIDEGQAEDEVGSSHGRERKVSQSEALLKTDAASELAICDLDLVNECERGGCKLIHNQHRLPYLWQVNLFGEWRTLQHQEMIENSFCDRKERSDVQESLTEGVVVVVVFSPIIQAQAQMRGDVLEQSIPARRLSTPSFSVNTELTDGSFKTQWRWYFIGERRVWQLFEPDSFQHTLESKYVAKQETYNYSRENYRWKYHLNFEDMSQLNMDTRRERHIFHRPLYVCKEDVLTRTFPPCLNAVPNVEAPLPQGWVPWDLAHPFELVKLNADNPSYKEVAGNFYRTLSPNEQIIDAIYRVQNHALWLKYCHQEKTMISHKVREGSNTPVLKKHLYHGTYSLDAVRGISINNFDARVSGRNATMYGDGAYFARDAKYSHSYTNPPEDSTQQERFMFQVLVLVGDYTTGQRDYRRPPVKPGKDHELFDSCVNNQHDPTIFILFEKSQYYPEYLIQYHNASDEARPRKPVASHVPASVMALQTGNPPSLSVSSSTGLRVSTGAALSPTRPAARSSYPDVQITYPHPVSPTSPTASHTPQASSRSSSSGVTSANPEASRSESSLSGQNVFKPVKKKEDSCSVQ